VVMGGFSILGVLLGACLTCLADQYPRHRPMMERVAGGFSLRVLVCWAPTSLALSDNRCGKWSSVCSRSHAKKA
jgi:hypothetical protein